ncbi:MAG: DUF4159 domain-containing protein, partial [Dehalococcoidia bacterium]
KGGVLVRFAGPRLEKGGDDLIPAALRLGGRTLGGALSWSTPQPLGDFGEDSLFAGLAVPKDVTVSRQVLADPARLGPEVKVWARLKDGTPLVTAAERGRGQIVLFHVTANAEWSNLPLSGLFVEMLRRISTLGRIGAVRAGGTATTDGASGEAARSAEGVLTPQQTLDGFGILRTPPPTVQAIPAAKLAETKPGTNHHPGFYGPPGSPRALNLLTASSELKPLPPLPSGAERRAFESQAATPLKPALLAAALGLLFADIIAVVLMQLGGLIGLGLGGAMSAAKRAAPGGGGAAAVLLAAAVGFMSLGAEPAQAQSDWQFRPLPPPYGGDRSPFFQNRPFLPQAQDQVRIIRPTRPPTPNEQRAMKATDKVALGYVVTGDSGVDAASRAGLSGLVKILAFRTAVEAAEPAAINIDTDEIVFYPVIYWPVVPSAGPLSDRTLAKIDAYMKEGGMIVFDTRDYGQGMPTGLGVQRGGEGGTPLQRLLGSLDIPRLEPAPENHVLTKSFYLLRSFPGRWDGGQMWVEADGSDDLNQGGRKARRADGVSSILVTSNDLAAAWALDDNNTPLYPVVPGGERQREMAFRTGVNIVMYALTGNYKADQVHAPALLERLGQ